MKNFEVKERHQIKHRAPIKIAGITFEAFSVLHSILAPAVGYRISAGKTTIFYVPDLVAIRQRRAALKGVKLYIGDGATITGGHLVRCKNFILFGHTSIRTQLGWCKKEKVPKMIVTHCGSEIVEGDERSLVAKIKSLAKERAVEVKVAYDGYEKNL